MKTYIDPSQRPNTQTAVAIGSFDGVHLGHQALLARLTERARHYGVPSVVYTFDPPTRVLTQGVEFLSTLPEKLELLERYGIDEVIAVPFNAEFAARPKEQFLADLKSLNPRAIVVGEDFYFGQGRGGCISDLSTICADVTALPMHSLSGEDIKSTRIRECLKVGDIAQAQRFLGRAYSAQGVVVRGNQLGRTMGFPTANIQTAAGKALPLGIYAARVRGAGGGTLGGMAYIGTRPTVNGQERRFEVNLLDFAGDLYGAELEVTFVKYLRSDLKLNGLDELKGQLERDLQDTRAALE